MLDWSFPTECLDNRGLLTEAFEAYQIIFRLQSGSKITVVIAFRSDFLWWSFRNVRHCSSVDAVYPSPTSWYLSSETQRHGAMRCGQTIMTQARDITFQLDLGLVVFQAQNHIHPTGCSWSSSEADFSSTEIDDNTRRRFSGCFELPKHIGPLPHTRHVVLSKHRENPAGDKNCAARIIRLMRSSHPRLIF